jgi:hypothetical protein
MNKSSVSLALLIFGASLLGSCTDSRKQKPPVDAGSDAGKTLDAGKDAGKTGAAGTTAPPVMTAKPVPCGSKMCSAPASPLGMLGGAIPGLPAGGAGGLGIPMAMACCLDEATGSCGLTATAGGMCEPPATRDMRCMGVDLGALAALAGNMGFGCCINNQCGVDGSAFGRGCVPAAEAKTMLAAQPLVGGLIMVPAPRACDGDTGNDAGSMTMTGQDAGQ